MRTTTPQDPSSSPSPTMNRAERRAAARGKTVHAGHPAAPRASGPRERTKPVHVRTDYAARRSG